MTLPLNAFSSPHPWLPTTIRLSPTPSLHSAQASRRHHLYMLDCRGHNARDMQRTLDYINAELKMREVDDIALQEIQCKEGREWMKKKDDSVRMREMEDEDARWEKEWGGNPRWGEGRTALHYEK